MNGQRRRVAAVLAASMLLAGRNARAQSAQNAAEAEVLFEQAKALMATKEYPEACAKFAESNRLDVGIGTMLWLAECYEKNGQSASAWAQFVEAADAAAKGHDKRQKVARDRAAQLEPFLSRLTLEVPQESDVPGLEVTRDGTAVGRAVWGTLVPVDPGPHVFGASAPARKSWQATVSVEAGRQGVVTVPPLEVEQGSEAPAVVAPPITGQAIAPPSGPQATIGTRVVPPVALGRSAGGGQGRAWGIAAATLGAVGIGAGSVLGFVAKSQLDASNSGDHCSPDNSCDAFGTSERHKAFDSATASTVAFVAGGALLVGAIVLFVVAPSSSAGPPSQGTGSAAPLRPGLGIGVSLLLGTHVQGLAARALF